MKLFIPLFFVLLPFAVDAQRYSIEEDAICWQVSGVDSNLTRLTQISFTGASRVVGFVNESGATVSPSGGTLLYGVCECCNATTPTATSSQIVSFITSQPTFNPFNPSACNSSATILFESTVDEAHISITLNGSPVSFTYFPGESPRRASASFSSSTGSGINTVELTLSNGLGTEVETRTFDCGGS